MEARRSTSLCLLSYWRPAAFLVVFLILSTRLIEKILSAFTKDFWQDPIKHNVAAYLPTGLRDLLLSIAVQDQPVLDYALRKYVFFPLLGFNERTFRTPDALSAIAALATVVYVVFLFLRRQGHPRIVSGVFALLGGAWVVAHPLLMTYAVEGRHYMLSALASFAWFASLYLFAGRPRALLVPLTAVFANVHFFALPFVGVALLLETVRSYRAGDKPDTRLMQQSAILIPAFTIALNLAAFHQLVSHPPAPAEGHAVVHGLVEGARSWKQFLEILALPLGGFLWLLAIIASWRPAARRAFLVAFLVVGPVFVGYMRIKSNYYFDPRYFLPFFGIGLVLLAYGSDGLIRAADFVGAMLAEMLSTRCPRQVLAGTLSQGILLLLVLAVFPIKHIFVETFTRFDDISVPGPNFTDEHRYYRRIQEFPGPKLVLYRRTYVGERFVPEYYLEIARAETDPFADVIPDPPVRPGDGVPQVQTFWRAHSVGTVVFDQPGRNCAVLSTQASAMPNTRIVQSKSRCALVVTGVHDLEEMRVISGRVGVSLSGMR